MAQVFLTILVAQDMRQAPKNWITAMAQVFLTILVAQVMHQAFMAQLVALLGEFLKAVFASAVPQPCRLPQKALFPVLLIPLALPATRRPGLNASVAMFVHFLQAQDVPAGNVHLASFRKKREAVSANPAHLGRLV